MAILRPFRALRPPAALAARVASPPYDVVNTREARALAAGNLDSFLRVSRPEIDLPEGTDEHADAVYAQGRLNLAELTRRGVLVADVTEGGPADRAGLARGDLILEVNRRPVRKPAEVGEIISKLADGELVLMRVRRGDGAIFLAVPLGGRQ